MIVKSPIFVQFLIRPPCLIAGILEDVQNTNPSHIKLVDLPCNSSFTVPFYLLQGCNQAQDPATPGSPPCGVDQDPSVPVQPPVPPQHMANIPPPMMLSGATPIRAPAPVADQHKVHMIPCKLSLTPYRSIANNRKKTRNRIIFFAFKINYEQHLWKQPAVAKTPVVKQKQPPCGRNQAPCPPTPCPPMAYPQAFQPAQHQQVRSHQSNHLPFAIIACSFSYSHNSMLPKCCNRLFIL